jgi:hypothetical protein
MMSLENGNKKKIITEKGKGYIENISPSKLNQQGMRVFDKEGKKYTEFFEKSPNGIEITSDQLEHPSDFSTEDVARHDKLHLFLKSRLDALGINTPSNTSIEGEMILTGLEFVQTHVNLNKEQLYIFSREKLQNEVKDNFPHMIEKYEIFRGYLMQVIALTSLVADLFEKMKQTDPNFLNSTTDQKPTVSLQNEKIYITNPDLKMSQKQQFAAEISKINSCLDQIEKRKQKIAQGQKS